MYRFTKQGKVFLLATAWVSLCASLKGASSKALSMHDYTYYDPLDYTAWDFAPYEKPKPQAFRGYLAHGFSEKQSPCLYFFPKTLVPKFDKTKLIPLEKAKERIQRINQDTLASYAPPQEPPPTATSPAKPKRIISQAGNEPRVAELEPSAEKEEAAVPSKNISPPAPLSTEDVLLFLKKKMPPGAETTTTELALPFQVPLSTPTPTRYPSQALYTQE